MTEGVQHTRVFGFRNNLVFEHPKFSCLLPNASAYGRSINRFLGHEQLPRRSPTRCAVLSRNVGASIGRPLVGVAYLGIAVERSARAGANLQTSVVDATQTGNSHGCMCQWAVHLSTRHTTAVSMGRIKVLWVLFSVVRLYSPQLHRKVESVSGTAYCTHQAAVGCVAVQLLVASPSPPCPRQTSSNLKRGRLGPYWNSVSDVHCICFGSRLFRAELVVTHLFPVALASGGLTS